LAGDHTGATIAMNIKSLFDTTKDIYRTIETVISYSAAQQDRLKTEITEYIVTESIEEHLEKLLTCMQLAMEGGGPSQVAVWVSEFYGSGKSSFTKYLGLALDESVKVEGVPFLDYLQGRLNKPHPEKGTTRKVDMHLFAMQKDACPLFPSPFHFLVVENTDVERLAYKWRTKRTKRDFLL
jgi:hypothetical protein